MTSFLFLVETIQCKQFRSISPHNSKNFLHFLLPFLNLHQILNILKKNMTFIGYVFPKLRTPKHVLTNMSKKSRLRWPLDRQHGKRAATLIQSQRQLLCHIHWSLWKLIPWKTSILVTSKVLRLFVNTLTADDKYSLLSRGNSTQTIQIHLSQKQETFSKSFWTFFKIYIKVWTFSKKRDPHGLCISEITDPETRG